MTTLPTFSELVDWLEGKLPAAEAARIAQAVQTDAQTQANVTWLRKFAELSDKIALAAPSPQVRNTLEARFAEHVAANRPPSFWQWLTATLSFDSRQQLATSGVRRGEFAPEKYQLMYVTDVADVVLHVEPQHKGINLYGQLLLNADGTELTGLGVQLVMAGVGAGLVEVDEVGEFAFVGINAGIYDLIISTPAGEILVEGIEIE
jgi:hypothetical protein